MSSTVPIALAAILLFLANPAAVFAAYTSTVVGSTATMTGDATGDNLLIAEAGGLFGHNRFAAGDPGFNSAFDFDTTVAGDQTISATTGVININAGDGNDSIVLSDGIDLRGAIDGGDGIDDTIDYAAFTTAIRANLGLGTTGLSATPGADQENPPTTHAGTATATVTNYNLATRTFDITVTVSGLAPADVTGFHIHQAAVGVNGPIIVDFTGVAPLVPAGTGFTFTATGLVLPAASEAAFLGGGTYVNIHTAAFPGGAIRGQLFSSGNVNLPAGAATGTTGIANIENVAGGTAGDSLVGNFGTNMFSGGAGADWIVGGPGGDILIGDAGADVLVWSNGDGSDVMEGGADGDTVQVNGSTAAADVFTVAANGARLDFDRTNLGPFSLDIGTTETLTVNGIGGDDSVTTASLAGVASVTTVNLNGFDGNDTFAYAPTAAGAVVFNAHGGPGTDTIQGPNGASTWNVTGANAGDIAGLVTSFRFIETLSGGTAVDIFNVKGFAAGALTVTGGDGADTLNYDAEGRAVSGDTTAPDGAIASPGVQPVTFTQIELIYLLNAGDTAPTITPIANQTISANTSTAALAFTVGDLETPVGNLIVSGSSSNTALVPDANIVFGGSGANRTVTVTPAADGTGTATITVSVSDGVSSTPTAFVLTVNAPTTVQPPSDLHVSALSGNLVTFRFLPSTLGPAATGFVLEGGIVPGQVLASVPTGSDAPIFTITAPTGSFYVRVHAIEGVNHSAASNEIRVHINVPVPPSSPDLFRATEYGDSVVLSWRNTFAGGEPASLVLDVGGAASAQIPLGLSESLTVNGVPPGNYTLNLRAVNGGGSSFPSSPVTVTVPSLCEGPPEVPSNVLGYHIGNSAFVVWDPPAAGPAASTYVLFVSGSFVGSFATTGRSLSGQVGPGSYTVSVVAVNPCGASPASAPQTIVIP